MDPSVLPASRVPPCAPATVTGHQHESGCEQGLSQLQARRGQKGSLTQKSHPGWGEKPLILTPTVDVSRENGGKSQKQHAEENGEGKRRVATGRHSDLLPEAEAAEEEECERAKAALRWRDGRFFHMAATPRYGHPSPIPVAYK